MCQFCERRKGVKLGWNQPGINGINGNIVDELEVKAVIHDYKTVPPEMIITMPEFFPIYEGNDGIATIYIKIKYCPICGRKLGLKD